MNYNPQEIEPRLQQYWRDNNIYKVEADSTRPKFYVLDMFPYPSGAGLHVGHPLGYIASDIYSRYKRLKGFNVLHPMGYDAYGLPAEQYAIQTGQHPETTTTQNIARYRSQLEKMGSCSVQATTTPRPMPHAPWPTSWHILKSTAPKASTLPERRNSPSRPPNGRPWMSAPRATPS